LSKSSSKYGLGIRDPRSGKNPFRIPDPGIKKAPDPGYRIRNTVTKFLKLLYPVLENKMEMKMRCCGSRMFIPDPGSGSPFPDAKNHKKEEGEK
jgi:hypothetical protein